MKPPQPPSSQPSLQNLPILTIVQRVLLPGAVVTLRLTETALVEHLWRTSNSIESFPNPGDTMRTDEIWLGVVPLVAGGGLRSLGLPSSAATASTIASTTSTIISEKDTTGTSAKTSLPSGEVYGCACRVIKLSRRSRSIYHVTVEGIFQSVLGGWYLVLPFIIAPLFL